MGYEPGAARRLRLLCAGSRDSQVRSILSDLLEDDPMPSSPRELLLSTFDETDSPCDLSPSLATPPTSLGGELESLVTGLSGCDTALALVSLSEHAAALRLVWEAHVRGAITLPPTLARRVMHARRSVPPYLTGERADECTKPPVLPIPVTPVLTRTTPIQGIR
jgi:hypothetical protein